MKIPRKLSERFIYVCNAQDPLATDLNPHPELIDALLISEQYSAAKTLALIKNAQKRKKLIVSDNGNFTRISLHGKKYLTEAKTIVDAAQLSNKKGKKVTAKVLKLRTELINKICTQLQSQQSPKSNSVIIQRQLICKPHYMIGLEDYTIPILGMNGLLDPVFGVSPDEIKPYQEATKKLYRTQEIEMFGTKKTSKDTSVFLVHHAFDYETAEQAARLSRSVSPGGIAVSFAAPMSSRNYINSLKIGTTTIQFKESLPESYLLGVSTLLGIIKGAKKETPIHLLGLGSPILIILLSLLLRKSKAISIDSTSNFKDADDGTIYGSRNAYLKMDMYKVAAYALVNDDPYHSSSPWYATFDKLYPSNWNTLRQTLGVTDKTDVELLTKQLRKSPDLLEKYIPFFTPMRAGASKKMKDIRIARSGCNYWVLRKICSEVRKRVGRGNELKEWVENEVERYSKSGSQKWSAAVRECYTIIDKYS